MVSSNTAFPIPTMLYYLWWHHPLPVPVNWEISSGVCLVSSPDQIFARACRNWRAPLGIVRRAVRLYTTWVDRRPYLTVLHSTDMTLLDWKVTTCKGVSQLTQILSVPQHRSRKKWIWMWRIITTKGVNGSLIRPCMSLMDQVFFLFFFFFFFIFIYNNLANGKDT